MAAGTKFYSFIEALAEKKHDLGADTLKVMLTNTAPSQSNTQKSDITEISAGNGYTAGGAAVTITGSSQTSGAFKLVGNDVVFTASGGAIATFRYIVLYNDTSTNDLLICYWDVGTQNVSSGNSFTVDFSGTNGILQLA